MTGFHRGHMCFCCLCSDPEHGLHDGICIEVGTVLWGNPCRPGTERWRTSSPFSFYNTKSVVLCLGITSLVCLSVTIFSFQSKVRAGPRRHPWCPLAKLKLCINLPQVDVTSYQGVLFSLCMVLLLCAITISIVVPFGYVSSRLQSKIDLINDLNNPGRRISVAHLACCYPSWTHIHRRFPGCTPHMPSWGRSSSPW